MIASFFYPYGANRNIKIFIGSDDPETRKEFSDLCGQKKIKNFSVNTNVEHSASSNTGAGNQPLITVGMLERLNGNTKGDAIVSVRGYEPIWATFTPSYELKGVYFREGKVDISKREAVLFEKDKFVFDIMRKGGKSDDEILLDKIDEDEEKENAEDIEKQKRVAALDVKWQSIADSLVVQIEEFSKLLEEEDANALKKAKLENKIPLLYNIMDNYEEDEVRSIENEIQTISKTLLELKSLQNEATK